MVAAVLAIGMAAWPALAEHEVLHEYFAPDTQEDLLLRATTLQGSMPAAFETQSGPVRAPDAARSPYSRERAYGGSSTPSSSDASYGLDRDTTRPDSVSYDDPFNPAVTPFKRLYAFDSVNTEFELTVSAHSLRKLEIGGTLQAGDDQFYGDLVVDLARNEPVRIPSVGPGSRILAAEIRPPTDFEILADGADNWFIRTAQRRRVRLTLQLAIPRVTFGSKFPDISYSELPRPPALPMAVGSAARDVLTRLELGPSVRPRLALESLVSYFRGFTPSDQIASVHEPAELYRELTLSQRGVCRHRAFAFMITALALGLPSRFVRNEAHAWVEVSDGKLWHRIDLGGAANQIDLEPRETAYQHTPPPDPFLWPEGAETTGQVARRAIASATPAPVSPTVLTPPGAPDTVAAAPLSPTAAEEASRSTARIELRTQGGEVRRGALLQLAGRITARDGSPCSGARLDVALAPALGGAPVPMGSLPTNLDGTFDGAVTVRSDIDVGEYQLQISSMATAACGPSQGI